MSEEKQPKIRFKGFDDPWEQRKFSDIAMRRSKQTKTNSLPSIEFENIVSDEGKLKDGFDTKSKHKQGILFEQNDILFGKLRPYLHNWFFATFRGIAVGDFWVLFSQQYDSLFLYYLIQSERFQSIANISTGTKMPRSDWNLVSKAYFYISLDEKEQIYIGKLFKNIDKIIAANQSKLEQLKRLKKLLMQKIFNQEWRFKGFTDPWEQRKLSELAKIQGGGTPDSTNSKFWNGEINWFTPTEVSNQGYLFESNKKISKSGLKHSSAKLMPVGTVLMTSRAGVGNMGILSLPAATNQGFQSMIPNEDTPSYFLFSMHEIISRKANKLASGSTFTEISGKSTAKITLYIPNKRSEKEKIAELFFDLDNRIAANQRRLDQLQSLKKYLMQNMFV